MTPAMLVKLTKIDPENDPEAFLLTFEHMATVEAWLLDHIFDGSRRGSLQDTRSH